VKPSGPEIFRFYRSLGLNLKQLYGQTEASVYITAQPDGEIRADTVGRPMPDVELKIADNGEVMYRSPGVFVGYNKNKQATAKTKTKDGWVNTGDAGFFDDRRAPQDHRPRQGCGPAQGRRLFPPKYIENKLKFFPNIKEAVAFGDGRDFDGDVPQYRPDRGGQLGRAQQHRLCQLSGTRRPSARL
jgi:long-chain acyl-CoA synthetase